MAGRSRICAVASAALLFSPALTTAAAADDGDGPDAQALAEEAQRNAEDADSLRLELEDRAAADKRSEPKSMDLTLDRQGNCVGALAFGADGGTSEFVKQGDEVWMKGDRAYWKAQDPDGGTETADLLQDRYVHGTTDEKEFKDFEDVCDLRAFQKDLAVDSFDRTPTKGEATTLDDVAVIPVRGEMDGVATTLYITSDAPHLLVESVQKGDGTDETSTFSDYDEPVPSATPAPDQSVDLSDLDRESENR
ncbi:hypothetical protein JK359_05275 [Streptomyces actinomycinicus]|uniref:Lipoprotein n=1 Tax=Streptomyces actinomycinicus TaxID=1695166 RepID=A0A937EFW9_9ACTN|nr:hypothetical protein [Streptomyces actinomycinicus]MBL1081394.1 hypothetical protein [Streptomyces actinomycinicus]